MDFKLNGLTADSSIVFGEPIAEPSEEAFSFALNFNRSISKSQQVALDSFVSSLKQSNVWNKIERLFIPAIGYNGEGSSNLEDAFIDLRSSWGSSVVHGEDPSGVLTTNFIWGGNGIKGTEAASLIDNGKRKGVKLIDADTQYNNSHLLVMKDGTFDTANSTLQYYERGLFCGEFYSPLRLLNKDVIAVIDNYNAQGINNNDIGDNIAVFGYNVINNKVQKVIDSDVKQQISDLCEVSELDRDAYEADIMFGCTEKENLSVLAISYGVAMEQDEITAYISALKDLIDNFV